MTEEVKVPIKFDWVKTKLADGSFVFGKIDTLAFEDVVFDYLDHNNEVRRIRKHRSEVELMTEAEKIVEIERGSWHELGRKPGEFHKGDIYVDGEGEIYKVIEGDDNYFMETRNISIKRAKIWYECYDFRAIYPIQRIQRFREEQS